MFSMIMLLNLFLGIRMTESASHTCQSKIFPSGYGQIESPDFPAVKSAYTCRNYFHFPKAKGAVILNVTDISLYYHKERQKVCSGSLQIGTYKAPCIEAAPICIIYFNDLPCIQPHAAKYRKLCQWYKTEARSIEMIITSDGRVGEDETDNNTASSWSYPKGIRMNYKFFDCPQDPLATESPVLTPRMTVSPGQIRERTITTTSSILFPWIRSTTKDYAMSSGNTNETVTSGSHLQENKTAPARYNKAGILTVPEIIVISVVAFVVLVVLVTVIILIIVKAKGRKKSWSMRLPSVLGREYRTNGDVPPPGRPSPT